MQDGGEDKYLTKSEMHERTRELSNRPRCERANRHQFTPFSKEQDEYGANGKVGEGELWRDRQVEGEKENKTKCENTTENYFTVALQILLFNRCVIEKLSVEATTTTTAKRHQTIMQAIGTLMKATL
ncbi:hypothetical protein RUM43_008904 [Polyplax serrata]|uniref:Uncharacterized protein n=1 Tax=Polyplax serrata TaxID=468196 RepID=A0AAN8NV29_POLSC